MRIPVIASLLVFVAATAWAQQPAAAQPTPTDLTKGTVMTSAELHAAIAKAGSDRPLVPTRVFTLAGAKPYAINVEHRPNVMQAAAIHETEAELFYVIDGSGTMVTGGKLVEETRTGPNLSGKSIAGGVSTKLNKGDFFMVPEGVPHWFSQIDPAGLNIMSIHFPRK